MKPYPFVALNHFTVPDAISQESPLMALPTPAPAEGNHVLESQVGWP
jgi:hypothetical protein